MEERKRASDHAVCIHCNYFNCNHEKEQSCWKRRRLNLFDHLLNTWISTGQVETLAFPARTDRLPQKQNLDPGAGATIFFWNFLVLPA